MLRNFYEIDTGDQFYKKKWVNLCRYQCISLSFDLDYTARGVNYAKKSFMKLTQVAYFTIFFWCSLHCYWCFSLRFDTGYDIRGVNYAEKSYMKLRPGANVIKLFTFVIYEFLY